MCTQYEQTTINLSLYLIYIAKQRSTGVKRHLHMHRNIYTFLFEKKIILKNHTQKRKKIFHFASNLSVHFGWFPHYNIQMVLEVK